MAVRDGPLEITGELRVVTEASIWLIRADTYMRMPRCEQPRPRPESSALIDHAWHPHTGVWRVTDATGTWLRILPPGRPPGASGIQTGLVVAAPSVLFDGTPERS